MKPLKLSEFEYINAQLDELDRSMNRCTGIDPVTHDAYTTVSNKQGKIAYAIIDYLVEQGLSKDKEQAGYDTATLMDYYNRHKLFELVECKPE